LTFGRVSDQDFAQAFRTAPSLRWPSQTSCFGMASSPNTPPVSSQAAESPEGSSSQRSPGLPKMEDIHFGLRFRDMEAAMEKWRDQNPQADTLRTLLADLGKAETMVAARKVLLPEAFADGMGTAETLCETVKHDLLAAILDDRSHRAVGGDISFDLRKCLPRPFMQAVASLSEGNGLHDEAVAWCFYANIAFLEHHTRRVGHKVGEHTEAPNLPVLIGGPPSSRKTCLISMTTDFMLHAEGAPDSMQNRECIIADATVAGLRSAIFNYNRAAVIADEAANVYDTQWSEKSSGGIHYLPKQKMNNYVHSEADDQATGKGQIHLGSKHHPYLFLHKVAGQTEIIEWVAQPVAHGFNKRFSLVFAPDYAPESAEVHTQTAKEFFEKLHAWMYQTPWREPGSHYLDGFALSCYAGVKKAVEETLAEYDLDKDSCRKIRFWATDVLRLAHANMRICQFAMGVYGRFDSGMKQVEARRTQPNVYEFLLAVRLCLRQVHVHLTFYKWFKKTTGSYSSERNMAVAMEKADDDAQDIFKLKASLSMEDRLKHEILVHSKAVVGEKIASDDVRLWLRNQVWYKKNRVQAEHIKKALSEMCDAGLLKLWTGAETQEEEPLSSPTAQGSTPKAKAGPKRGRKPSVYVKKAAAEIASVEAAEELRKRLYVPVKHF